MEQRRVFFRADGHQQMGLGHVVRSLALAEMLMDEYEITFVSRAPIASLKRQIQELGVELVELPWPVDKMEEVRLLCEDYLKEEDIVVIDGYHFTTEYQSCIKNKGCKLVAIDDIHAYLFKADVVINHALGINRDDYNLGPETQLKLGTAFCLIRKEIRSATRRTPEQSVGESILLCCGGSDPKNDSLRILKQLADWEINRPIHLVLGAAYGDRTELEAYLAKKSKLDLTIHKDLSADSLVNIFQRCPMAILPPSTIAYEYLSIGGLLFLEVIADNQIRMFESFVKYGLARPLSDFPRSLEINTNSWRKLLQHQATYFDGQQQARFKQIFAELSVATVV
ncbi:MAG: UDP-2,4-diacetamido-2,4,6-trideoxy-beta-L-altropyranose hydrolase [Saprospiraceae bacterium]|nr:UDP-2,4-diacetamido-2,4,6-trideoxy-beta-L-altropyranose hydrolase [Saprospiraceae bacterium]